MSEPDGPRRGPSGRSFLAGHAAVGVEMEEGTGKAIPLRRSRTAARPAAVPPPRASDGVGGLLARALEPPGQLWLATLGTAGVTVRGAGAAWELLVGEGEVVEAWLRRAIRRA